MARQVKKVEQEQQPALTRQQTVQTGDGGERTRARPVFVPRADIYETKDAIVLLAEMPGVTPEGVDVTLEKRVLTIHGHVAEQEHPGYRQIYAEYAEGDYERSFTLSEDIDRNGIEASHSNGVLRLVLPKAESAKAKKIQVRSV